MFDLMHHTFANTTVTALPEANARARDCADVSEFAILTILDADGSVMLRQYGGGPRGERVRPEYLHGGNPDWTAVAADIEEAWRARVLHVLTGEYDWATGESSVYPV